MKAGRTRRGVAAALLLLAIAVPGDAAADHAAFTVGSVPGAEGGSVVFTVSLAEAAPAGGLTLTVTANPGTAGVGDYGPPAPAPLVLDEGATSGTVSVPTSPDSMDEEDEQFTLSVRHGEGTPVTATGTITDDDAPPSVTIAAPAGPVDEGGVAVFPIALSAASGRTVQVSYQTIPASSPDFVGATNASVALAPGTTSASIEVQTVQDGEAEGSEGFTVALNPCNATCTLGAQTQAAATIADDEPAPTVSVADASVAEGARNPDTGEVELAFTLSLSQASAAPVSVSAQTQDGTALAPSDYQQKSQPFTFAAGQTEKTFVVVVNDDALDEPGETVTVVVLNDAGVEVDRAEGTIVDDDNTSMLAVGDASVDEPGSGAAALTFTVTLSPASARTVTVDWTTADGTATAGSDYTAAGGTLTFAPGAPTSQTVTVQVAGDTVVEENETLRIGLHDAAGAGVADAEGLGTIVDKNAPPTLTVSDALTREGEGATFTVELLGTTLRTVTVGFATSDGSARAGTDYLARVGTLTFAPGEKQKTVAVTIVDDALTEPAETLSLALGDPANATIGKLRGTATIEASDQAGATTSGPPRPPTTTPPTVPTRLLPRMTLTPRLVRVTRTGVAVMAIACAKASPLACAGSVSLETAAKPKLRLGTKRFRATKGKRVRVPIALSRRGLRLLGARGTLRVRPVVLVRAGAGTLRVVPGIVTLKAPPKPAAKRG